MRHIDEIIVHCTATPEGRPVTVAEIDRWHRDRGWSGIGYHHVVHLDGRIEDGRPVARAGAHVGGRNAHTIGVVYVGGIDRAGRAKDTRTPAQKAALERLLRDLLEQHPTIHAINGHNRYAAKACPSFDATSEYAYLLQEAATAERPPAQEGMPDHLLMRGAFGPAVRAWQDQLRAFGYDITADGVFGPLTEQVTRWFQRGRGLVIDGVVGPQTHEAMDDALARLAEAA